jgi:hypothetical protein
LILSKNSILKVLIIFIMAVLIIGITISGCRRAPDPGETTETIAEEEESIEEPKEMPEDLMSKMEIKGNINILSGLEISDEVNNDRPFAIMVENSQNARPQSGLDLADIIFEVVDEGGITRLIAIYSSYDAEVLGPIRSARQYYAEIARNFDPVYVFFGTYPEGYKIIEDMDMDVLSAIGDPTGVSRITALASHWRDSSRVQPHNAYMSTLSLKEDSRKAGHALDGGQSPLRFKFDFPEEDRGDITDITIDFSVLAFKSDFKYDKSKNMYSKFIADSPHTDRETEKQLTFNNVVSMITDIVPSGNEAGHMIVRTTGSGKALFFMDGNVTEGSWERMSVLSPFEYFDSNGEPVLFNRGKTYVSMVQSIDRVTY